MVSVRPRCSVPVLLAAAGGALLCFSIQLLTGHSYFRAFSGADEFLLDSLVGDSLRSLEPPDPVELKCPMYQEFRRVDFLSPVLRNRLCLDAEAYRRYQDGYPLCKVGSPFPEQLLSIVRRNSDVLELVSISKAPMPMFAYKGKDFISDALRQSKSWESALVERTLRLALKVPDTTFMDIGSNIGVYSVQAARLGLPVVALDANIRNLLRLHLSLNASGLNAGRNSNILVWNFITTKQQLMYLSFLADCNVGAAGKQKAQLPDTVPIMPMRGEKLANLVKTKHIVMKVDIQGGEGDFIRTAGGLFDQRIVVAVQMEWTYDFMTAEDAAVVVNFFTVRGYKPFRAPKLEPLIPAEERTWNSDDMMWVHKDFVSMA